MLVPSALVKLLPALVLSLSTTTPGVEGRAIAGTALSASLPRFILALEESAAEESIRYQPILDYDGDGCYNAPAIDADGNVTEGLTAAYTTPSRGCREPSMLNNMNVYSRSRCNSGWCAYMYSHYFPKDVVISHVDGVGKGHRHEWENIVVWVRGREKHPAFVASSQHGGYGTRVAAEVQWEDHHPKMVYHKEEPGSHNFRFAHEADNELENHQARWIRGALIDWSNWPSKALRNKMLKAFDNGSGNRPKIDDAVFADWLCKAKDEGSKLDMPIQDFVCALDGRKP